MKKVKDITKEERQFDKVYKGLKLTKKQKEFLRVLHAVALNVAETCKRLGISRAVHDMWLRSNDDYRMCVSHIEEAQVDFAQTMLIKRMSEGSDTLIWKFLKTKGSHRGYGENQSINLTMNKPETLSHLSDDELEKLIKVRESEGK
jgi:hypothetical protein